MNFTPIEMINTVVNEVNNERYNTVFIDFDETFQTLQGPFALHLPYGSERDILPKFSDIGRPVTVT